MKRNSIFLGMIGLSVALHSLALIGMPGGGFRSQTPDQEDRLVQTVKMIRVETRPPTNPPQEKKVLEKPAGPLPEIRPAQETVPGEETRENDEAQKIGNNIGYNEAMPESGDAESEGDRTLADREYDALLAYVKNFIDKNLVYPPMARRRNIEGIVGVSFEIERTGGIAAITVAHSSGSSILDNAAVSLVKKMHPLKNIMIKRELALRVNIEYKLTE
jgi:protein TonB